MLSRTLQRTWQGLGGWECPLCARREEEKSEPANHPRHGPNLTVASVRRLTGTESHPIEETPPHINPSESHQPHRRARFQTLEASVRPETQWTPASAIAPWQPRPPNGWWSEITQIKTQGKTLQKFTTLFNYLSVASFPHQMFFLQ